MAKFGELISEKKPVLINFYSDLKDIETLNNVVAVLGDKAKVLKINISENQLLVNALQVKENPTFMIFDKGEIKWRKTGFQEANTLISLILQYV